MNVLIIYLILHIAVDGLWNGGLSKHMHCKRIHTSCKYCMNIAV
jgi:hypothetical protein